MLTAEDILTPNLSTLTGLSAARRGMADGMAGVPMQTESPAYADAHARGRLLGMAERGQAVVSFARVTGCSGCGAVYFGDVAGCACEPSKNSRKTLVRGILGAFGRGSSDEPAAFMPDEDVAKKTREGVRVYTDGGVDVTNEFNPEQ